MQELLHLKEVAGAPLAFLVDRILGAWGCAVCGGGGWYCFWDPLYPTKGRLGSNQKQLRNGENIFCPTSTS